jgi:hypothetical protein
MLLDLLMSKDSGVKPRKSHVKGFSPPGQRVAPGGLSAWLIAAESRSVGLLHHASAWPDCQLALEILQRDMAALCRVRLEGFRVSGSSP